MASRNPKNRNQKNGDKDAKKEEEPVVKIDPDLTALCKVEGCTRTLSEHGKHRHSVKECNEHKFCVDQPIPSLIENWRTQLPIMQPHDLNEVNRIIARDTETGGQRSVKELVKENNDLGYFGHDQPIPSGKKLLMTDPALDGWLAAHYNMNPDKIPSQRPATMSKYVHNRLKKGFYGPNGHGTVRRKRNAMS